MPLLIVPIGFSGSGKTTYYKRNYDPNKTIYISLELKILLIIIGG